MTDVPSAQTVILVAVSAIALTALIATCLIMARRTTRRHRAWDQPVDLQPIPERPDSFSEELDRLDIELAALARDTWPDAEWERLLTCPHPNQEGLIDQRRAEEKFPGAEPYACRCGLWHVRAPAQRRARWLRVLHR